MLTEKAVLAATPRERDYKIADSGGLHLFVTAKGVRSWRYKYRFGGRENPSRPAGRWSRSSAGNVRRTS